MMTSIKQNEEVKRQLTDLENDFTSLVIALAAKMTAASRAANAEDLQRGDLYYRTENGSVIITGCNKDAASVEIPPEIDSYPVTAVGAYAFSHCTDLTSINIPSGVTVIGDYAFGSCKNLTDISIPESTTQIGRGAFSDCIGLTDITLPERVASMGNYAFYNCKSLTNINIPAGVTHIGAQTFTYCGSLAISVDGNNRSYSSKDGVLFNKDATELIAYTKDKICSEYTLPSGVKAVGKNAFSACHGLTGINIPKGVKTIDDRAFYGCTGLINITIPDSLTAVNKSAFYRCESLTDIYYGGTSSQWSQIQIAADNEWLTSAEIHFGDENK